jgi:hypothetical protein
MTHDFLNMAAASPSAGLANRIIKIAKQIKAIPTEMPISIPHLIRLSQDAAEYQREPNGKAHNDAYRNRAS